MKLLKRKIRCKYCGSKLKYKYNTATKSMWECSKCKEKHEIDLGKLMRKLKI